MRLDGTTCLEAGPSKRGAGETVGRLGLPSGSFALPGSVHVFVACEPHDYPPTNAGNWGHPLFVLAAANASPSIETARTRT